MLRPTAAQSRLLSDSMSLSSPRETGFLACQSVRRDWTFGPSMFRLHLRVSTADTCYFETHFFSGFIFILDESITLVSESISSRRK